MNLKKFSITFIYLLFTLLGVFLNLKCKKDVHSEIFIANEKDIAVNWINQQKQSVNEVDRQILDSIYQLVDWGSYKSIINNEQTILLHPIITRGDKTFLLLFYDNISKSINLGYLVDIDNQTIGLESSQIIIENFFKNQFQNFTGKISFFNIINRFVSEYSYRNGKKEYYKSVRAKYLAGNQKNIIKVNSTSSPNKLLGTGYCVYYYEVTTYSDGTEIWDLMYSYCVDDDCQTTRVIPLLERCNNIRVFCGGGNSENITINDPLCPNTFSVGKVTSDGSYYSTNVIGLNFNDMAHVNSFDMWIGCTNFISDQAMNTIQNTASIFLGQNMSPLDLLQSYSQTSSLFSSGDINYTYNNISQDWGGIFPIMRTML
jgi:hypothetical protein